MSVNVIYEYSGPIIVWDKAIRCVAGKGPKLENLEAQEVLLYMKHYIYTDTSHTRLFPYRPLFLTQTFLILEAFNVDKLLQYFPVDYHVKRNERTCRYDYKKERVFYKFCHKLVSEGGELKDHIYRRYECIALKYDWPCIVMGDDMDY